MRATTRAASDPFNTSTTLTPKRKARGPEQKRLDELMDSVDLSTYGLQRTWQEVQIGLDAAETELDLYKRYAGDADFKRAFDASISRLLASKGPGSGFNLSP